MEQEHPIPQQISAYQFRLVGDMTLKQFFQVAGGAVVALIFYGSTLPNFVRWPLIIFSFLLGVALAFFPLQDRPLSVWIVSFFKSIYSPTIFTWQKSSVPKQYFQPEPQIATPPVQSQEEEPEQLKPKLPIEEAATQFRPGEVPQEAGGEQPWGILRNVKYDTGKIESTQYETTTAPVRSKAPIPKQAPVAIPKQTKQFAQPAAALQQTTAVGSQPTPLQATDQQSLKAAQFSEEAAPPTPPTLANVVVGQVMDRDGKIVENAILEIKDSEGRAIRALKSNQLGHFMIMTPLIEGKYSIMAEKEGLNFEPVSFEATGKIIPPIAIKESSSAQQTQASEGSTSNVIFQQ